MKVADSLSLPHLDDILRNTLKLPAEAELTYSLSDNWNILKEASSVLKVKVPASGISREYVLVKVVSSPNLAGQETGKHPALLQPRFIVEDDQKKAYGAFEKECLNGFVSPERNNLKHLQAILKTLAQFQANFLAISNTEAHQQSEYALKDIIDNVAALDYFKPLFEQAEVIETLKNLQIDLDKLLKNSKLIVKSVWSNNVLVNNHASLFFEVSSEQLLLPPAYDALLSIFSLSDDRFRQTHFEDVVRFYFKSLSEALESENCQLHEEITRNYAENQLKILLPIVKLKYASDLAQTTLEFRETSSNLSNYLKYPLIQQEDVYEAIKNKLSSTDYSLLDYKLVPLTEKKGHLGEYFHLVISVTFEDKVKVLTLFAKVLVGATDFMRDVLDRGLGAKEDFFYGTLNKLFNDNGLESLLDFAPKCYLSRLSGLLILENFGYLGYTGLKPNAILNKNDIEIVLRQLAKLHASSLILEQKLSEQSGKTIRLNDEYAKYFEEKILLYDVDPFWFDGSLDNIYYIMNKCPDLIEDIGLSEQELKKKLKDVLFCIFSLVKTSETSRNVVNHGDMYVSNMLFKFGKDRIVEDAVLIDFQVLRYMPPAFEVLFFIFLSSLKDTRDQHLSDLLDGYYESLSNYLRDFSLELNEIYSKKQFIDDVNYMTPAAIGLACFYGNLTHLDPDLREEITHDQEKSKYYLEDHRDELMELGWKSDSYRKVLRGLMEDIADVVKSGF